MEGTIWTLVPPLLAIGLALITKEVYLSLLAGIIIGVLFYTNFQVASAFNVTVEIMGGKIGGNINIIIFLVLLGMIVALMNKSGASRAYGNWAAKNIRSKKGALLSTTALGVLIFVDDYFNCLTVGTIMSPITDKFKISRAKLAYIIDATAAPVCILAPVSSWAAAVASSLPEDSGLDGFDLFIKSIPFNYYALLTLIMVLTIIIFNFDFGKMRKYEEVYGSTITGEEKEEDIGASRKGRIIDLIIPIVILIIFCIVAMLYTGGIAEGKSIRYAFADTDASLSLVMGAFLTLIVIAALYISRRVITFKEFADALPEGFKAMVPAILILTFAWTLSGICGNEYLKLGEYVSGIMANSTLSDALIPAIFFVVAAGLSFATGTSWGTFAILLPIITAIFDGNPTTLFVISMSAVLAGAVCGDHCSPISDTTILSSTGAGCNHIDHVNTQLPYAMFIAAISFMCYVIAGLTGSGYVALAIGVVVTVMGLVAIRQMESNKASEVTKAEDVK